MDLYAVECYKKAGEISSKIKDLLKEFVKVDVKLLDIAEFIEGKIVEYGAVPAFPTNLSIDEIAAHYTPAPNDEKTANGLLKIDFGVCVDGYIADNAVSFDLTKENKHKEMIKLNKMILDKINKSLDCNSLVKDVGEITIDCLNDFNKKNNRNFKLIRNLCGHGLDRDKIHTGLIIPNYKNNSNEPIRGLAFAVEPFVTYGDGEIYEGALGNIYILNSEMTPRTREERKIIDFVKKNYKTRPFCERWLVNSGFKMTKYFLRNLENSRIIYQYPLLIEKSKGIVSQVENSFVCLDDDLVVLV